MSDFTFIDQGTIILVIPDTEAAQVWVDENLALEPWQYYGPGFACEPRYAGDLANGILTDGLTVLNRDG
jgi:hypothetical protein